MVETAEQDLFSVSVITIINTVFLVVFAKWVLPDIIKSMKEAKMW